MFNILRYFITAFPYKAIKFRFREINPSPNSTPGLVTGSHPGPAQSPPTPGGDPERNSWAQQQQQFRMQQQEKSLEGQMKQQGKSLT